MASSALPNIDAHNMAMLQALGELVGGKPIHEFSITEQRKLFRELQIHPSQNSGITVLQITVSSTHGDVKTYIYRPEAARGDLPFVYYIHGGGWIFGGAYEYEPFLFDLIARTGVAVVFPEYTLAPEKKYPDQQEQCLEVLQHVLNEAGQYGLKAERVAVAGDSAGCQIAAAVSILNKQQSLELPIVHQIMLHPLIDATVSYNNGILMTNEWAEQQCGAYFADVATRSVFIASPGLMTVDQAKQYMPATTVITSSFDDLRTQGENFARLLQTAGVSCGVVQAVGAVHDVEIFCRARESPTAELIMAVVSAKLTAALSGAH